MRADQPLSPLSLSEALCWALKQLGLPHTAGRASSGRPRPPLPSPPTTPLFDLNQETNPLAFQPSAGASQRLIGRLDTHGEPTGSRELHWSTGLLLNAVSHVVQSPSSFGRQQFLLGFFTRWMRSGRRMRKILERTCRHPFLFWCASLPVS